MVAREVHPEKAPAPMTVTLSDRVTWASEVQFLKVAALITVTREGSVIRVNLETTPTTFYATVEDDGGGVPAKDLPHLFERFYRAQGSAANGAGIGLAIVQEIIHRHHGNIYAENISGGLRIKISLPILNLAKS